MSIIDLLGTGRLVPVVVVESVASVAPLADALVRGGLPCAEVTLRTPAALPALRAFAERSDMIVGAGSVRTAEQVDQAIQAGARFVVSPGISDRVLDRCRDLGVPAVPGVATATEIMRALDAGVDVVKLFPAGLLGGPAGVRTLAAPFPTLRFVPTGGIGQSELADYLREPAVLAVGGSWMVAPHLLRAGHFDEIERLTRDAVMIAVEVRP
jgi:2-dehydro-3-deoxyphosphogluconate aldolase / (4S)-4-hydroxy-2-oxoglutarate aldolase